MVEKTQQLMDNERNLILYSFLGLTLIYMGVNLPYKMVLLPVMAVSVTAGISAAFFGCLRYLERRKNLI